MAEIRKVLVDKIITQGETVGLREAKQQLDDLAKAHDGLAKSAAPVASTVDEVSKSVLDSARKFDAARGAVDPLVASYLKMESQIARLRRTFAGSGRDVEELEQAIARARARHEEFVQSSTRTQAAIAAVGDEAASMATTTGGAVQQMQYQFLQMGQQVMAGTSAIQAFSMQALDLAPVLAGQGGVKGALSLLASGVMSLINPVNLAIAGAAGLAAAVSMLFNDTEDGEAVLNRHEELIKAIAAAYEEAGGSAARFAEMAMAPTKAAALSNLQDIQSELQKAKEKLDQWADDYEGQLDKSPFGRQLLSSVRDAAKSGDIATFRKTTDALATSRPDLSSDIAVVQQYGIAVQDLQEKEKQAAAAVDAASGAQDAHTKRLIGVRDQTHAAAEATNQYADALQRLGQIGTRQLTPEENAKTQYDRALAQAKNREERDDARAQYEMALRRIRESQTPLPTADPRVADPNYISPAQTAIEGAEKRVSDLRAERDAMSASAGEAARLRMERELLAQANTTDPEEIARLKALAAEYGRLTDAMKAAQEAEQKRTQAAERQKSAMQNADERIRQLEMEAQALQMTAHDAAVLRNEYDLMRQAGLDAPTPQVTQKAEAITAWEEHIRAVKKAQDDAKESAEGMADTMEKLLTGIVQGGDSAKNAIKALLIEIARGALLGEGWIGKLFNGGLAGLMERSGGQASGAETVSKALSGAYGRGPANDNRAMSPAEAASPIDSLMIQGATGKPAFGLPPIPGLQRTADASDFSRVVEAGAGYTTVQLADGSIVKQVGARNWRNNNPGNIEYGKFAQGQGAIGTDGRFAVFPDYEAGRAAKEALLFESPSYRNLSLQGAINRYAPPFENNSAAYAQQVASATGVPLTTPLSSLDAAQRSAMLDAMQKVEGFRPGQSYLLSGPQSALGMAPEAVQQVTNQFSVLTPAMQQATQGMSALTDGVGTAAGGLGEFGSSLASAIGGMAGGGGGGGLSGLFGLGFKLLGGLFGGATGSPAGSIGGLYAEGGIAHRPSIFGEAGPEAAVPLSRGRFIPVDVRMRGGGGGGNRTTSFRGGDVYITVPGGGQINEDTKNELRKEFGAAIRSQQRETMEFFQNDRENSWRYAG